MVVALHNDAFSDPRDTPMTISIFTLANPAKDIHYLAALLALDNKVRHKHGAPYLYPQTEAFYQDNLLGSVINIIAVQGEDLVGYATLKRMSPWPEYLSRMHYPAEECAMFQFIMVDPDRRQMKIGLRLSQARLEYAKAAGWQYLFCTVHPDNIASCRNLLRLGFKVIEQRPMFSEQCLRNLMFLDTQHQTGDTLVE